MFLHLHLQVVLQLERYMPNASGYTYVIFFCLSYLGVNVTYLGSGPMNTLSLYPPSDLGEADC